MVIVISDPAPVKDEHVIINQLFDEGLEFFHLRKPGCSLKEMNFMLDQINPKYHSKISLHQHHELADSFGIDRLHFTEENRKRSTDNNLAKYKAEGKILSSSIHNYDEYKTLSSSFDYVFLGPVFNSLSKPGYNTIIKDDFLLPLVRNTKIVALGGVDSSKVGKVKEYGFDGIGILGIIWNEKENAVTNFKNIKNKWER